MSEQVGLKKTLGLADVYAISTGAMFSSGFFLLPGIAAMQSGTSVPLAYLMAGILILPAMLSVAELSTAMPRAGGAYYFLDRSMGPLMGTIGGLGTWLALVLKSAFALLGMGAYLMLFFDVPIKLVAVILTVIFAVVNVVGAKETSGLQRFLVFSLVTILVLWIAQGLGWLIAHQPVDRIVARHNDFLVQGIDGLFATVGVVFVSFAGLTKVASVAEEVKNPDRNIPLGMALSLATATFIYVTGVALMTIVLDPEVFHASLTPVAEAGNVIVTWIPREAGLILITVAASAAFASTGNAGIMSSSRYPMAMARDRLLPGRFARVSDRFGTPVLGVVVTSALMILLIIAFDITAVAKLASAFQLLLFGLINLAVIVMRESKISYYHPGFRSPYYPWVQIAGLLIPVWLIVEMGWLAVLFTMAVIALGIAWYYLYAAERVERGGAVYHVFERLGRRVYRGLDAELRGIVADKGLASDDPLEQVVLQAVVIEVDRPIRLSGVVDRVCRALSREEYCDATVLEEALLEYPASKFPIVGSAALANVTTDVLPRTRLVLIRAPFGISIPAESARDERTVIAMAVLVGPETDYSLHLRLLAHFSQQVEQVDFGARWSAARSAQELRASLLRDDRHIRFRVERGGPFDQWVGGALKESRLPRGLIVAMIRRVDGIHMVPDASTVLHDGDVVTAIGEPEVIADLRKRVGGRSEAS